VHVHPNPAEDIVWIEVEEIAGERAGYEFKDALGKVLIARDLGILSGVWKGSLDLSHLSSGVYFIEFTVGSDRHVERLTKY
jgi:hypothetical protein